MKCIHPDQIQYRLRLLESVFIAAAHKRDSCGFRTSDTRATLLTTTHRRFQVSHASLLRFARKDSDVIARSVAKQRSSPSSPLQETFALRQIKKLLLKRYTSRRRSLLPESGSARSH